MPGRSSSRFEQLADDSEGKLTLELRASADEGGHAVAFGEVADGGQQLALPDARGAEDGHHLSLAGRRPVDHRLDRGQLLVPFEQRDQVGRRHQLSHRPVLGRPEAPARVG